MRFTLLFGFIILSLAMFAVSANAVNIDQDWLEDDDNYNVINNVRHWYWTAQESYVISEIVFLDTWNEFLIVRYAGAVLHIGEGVLIECADQQQTGIIVIEGAQIIAEGTLNDPIVFEGKGLEDEGHFEGIELTEMFNGSAGNCIFEYCHFNNTADWHITLQVFAGSVEINNCKFYATPLRQSVNLYWAVPNETMIEFTNNTFMGVAVPAVHIVDGNLKFTDCDFTAYDMSEEFGQYFFEHDKGILMGEDTQNIIIEKCHFSGLQKSIIVGDEFAEPEYGFNIEAVIKGCDFIENQELEDGSIFAVWAYCCKSIDISNNRIEGYSTGIILTASPHPQDEFYGDEIFVHNNFIYGCSWVGIQTASTNYPRIYNNAIFEITRPDAEGGHGIMVDSNSQPDIIYNTIVNVAGSCIYLSKEAEFMAEDVTKIYNNVFEKWGDYAVEFTENVGLVNSLDRNLYSTPNPNGAIEIVEGDENPDTITFPWASDGYISNARSPDGGPDVVLMIRYGDDFGVPEPTYNSFGERLENDCIDVFIGHIGDVAAGNDPYDFHLYAIGNAVNWEDGDDPEHGAVTPCWVNKGYYTDWWNGDDPGTGLPWLLPVASKPDMGMYAGPFGDDFTDIEVPASIVVQGEYEDYKLTYNYNSSYSVFYGNEDENADFWLSFGDVYVRPLQGVGPLGEDQGGDVDGIDEVDNVILMTEDSKVLVSGTLSAYNTLFTCYDQTATWDGFVMNDTTNADSCFIKYCIIEGADYGLYAAGVDDWDGNSARVTIDSCTIRECGTGVYANDSRIAISNTVISGSDAGTYYGAGMYLTNCSSGQFVIDGCTVEDNGVDGTYASSGMYLYYSDPVITNCTIQDNTGCGIACFGSSPDLDTYDGGTLEDAPNTITSNGSGTQSGTNGAEIYLTYSSYPSINYNNIVDYDSGPVGYMIYKDEVYNYFTVNAENNYWGSTPSSSFFYWGTGEAIDYDPYSSYEISDFDDYALGMYYWERGEYEQALECFMDCVYDTSSYAVNAIHYMTGCVGEMEDGDFGELRDFLLDVSDEHESDEVAKVARRFATHCYTSVGNYEDAMDEYDDARMNADCLMDSVMAVVDYLAVAELAGIDMVDGSGNIHDQMRQAMDRLNDGQDSEVALPEDFTVIQAYPNPFNSTTTIRFNLQNTGYLKAAVYDVNGREVAVLHDGVANQGAQSLVWNAIDVPSGIYFCRLESAGKVNTLKMTLMR